MGTIEHRSYGLAVTVDAGIDEAEEKVRAALAEQGFGILTEIDVAATLKQKLDLDKPPYRILGACNPPLAAQALDADPDIGLLLPCNVVVREAEDGTVVEAVDPITMVALAGDALRPIAEEARRRLELALASL